jgi:TRAP-type C4-dicarboxylate transport system permease small subunit
MAQSLEKVKRAALYGEEILLGLLLSAMILLACLQIILRTFFAGGLFWADPVLRYLVIWSGFLGAVAATGRGRHIAIDLIDDHLPPVLQSWLTLVIQLFSALASAGLTWAGWRFVASEFAFGANGPLGLPLWLLNSIFPLAFALITLRYLLLFFGQARTVIDGPVIGREGGGQ